MENSKIVRVQENAYFIVDFYSFYSSSVTAYDPITANQTIVPNWDIGLLPQSLQPIILNEEEIEVDTTPIIYPNNSKPTSDQD